MSQQKVSIIVPVYNGERFISDTINSCLRQSYRNIEVLIVDDCSSDNSVKIIESCVHTCLRDDIDLFFLKNETNIGLSRTINKAVRICSGDYVLILGHDDIILPEHVSNMMLADKLDGVSLAYCNAAVIDANGKRIGQKIYSDRKLASKNSKFLKNISLSNFVPSCGLLFKRRFFLEVGGWDERFKNYGEWLLWIKLAHKGKFLFSKTDTALYRVHTQNISLTFRDKKIKSELKNYFKHCQTIALSYDLSLFERLSIYLSRTIIALYKLIVNNYGVFK
ncbi:glycosyltransferase [Aeromonas eucrenophila]|uniref:Glycosyltransferase n=1 Tax=Aeromonas eucrenophila TaxID=649 RepID=A0ABW0Y6C0_9GAMM|nr:glycosyltransferase [Aeromonas eucrenophila]